MSSTRCDRGRDVAAGDSKHPPPLSALLSQMLVAFTIELDNEFERQMPHRTTRHGGTRGAPWAVSLAMWSNFVRLVDDEGVAVYELECRARSSPHLTGMQRWGYVVVTPDPVDHRERVPRRQWAVRPTASGRRAHVVWRPLPTTIDARWRDRFGEERSRRLRAELQTLVDRSANVVRVLDPDGVRVNDISRRAGVAIEPIRTVLGYLAKRGYEARTSTDSARRWQRWCRTPTDSAHLCGSDWSLLPAPGARRYADPPCFRIIRWRARAATRTGADPPAASRPQGR